jgi:hypothetical protein
MHDRRPEGLDRSTGLDVGQRVACKRYGPKVEGAGLHHNQTPGPAGAKFIHGHNWVTLAWVVRHPLKIWLHTLIELWAWDKPARELVDRQSSPWNDEERRPSHGDRRNSLRRNCLEQEFQAAAATGAVSRKIEKLWRRVVRLVA